MTGPLLACGAMGELDIELAASAIGSETVGTPSTQTPTAKRQRRLTLTAMTGLICELAEDPPDRLPRMSGSTVQAVGSVGVEAAQDSLNVKDTAQLQECCEELFNELREPSPVRRLKRSRASISSTATVNVMAAQAAKLAANKSRSDSSDSTEEEEEDSLALRVRRAQAFECGAQAVAEPTGIATQSSPLGSPGCQQGELSPRSKIAYERGVRAALVADKVAAAMMSAKGADADVPSSTSRSGAHKGPLGQRLRGGA